MYRLTCSLVAHYLDIGGLLRRSFFRLLSDEFKRFGFYWITFVISGFMTINIRFQGVNGI